MDKTQSLALFEQGKDAWNDWAARMSAERKTLEGAGTWVPSSLESDWNDETKDWHARAMVDFSKQTFERGSDFSRFVFPGRADFRGTTFIIGINFNDATFEGWAEFGATTFKGGAEFSRATFEGSAVFGGTTFKSGADFLSATFKGDAYFDGTRFEGIARFVGATFKNDMEFRAAVFDGIAAFDGVACGRFAVFDGGRFEHEAAFQHAIFEVYAGFAEVTFEGVADFGGAVFGGMADFKAMNGKGTFSLAGATFRAVPDFIQAHFAEAPRFDDASIEPRRFSWPTLVSVFRGDKDHSARWRALKRLAVQGHDHMRELEFFKNELRTKRWVTDKPWHLVFLFGLLYGWFSDFGRSIRRPFCWWIASGVLFWWLYLGVHMGLAKQPFTAAGWAFDRLVQAFGGTAAPQLQCMVGMKGHPSEAAAWLSVRKALLFFGQGSGAELDPLHACLYRDVTQQSERFFADLPGSVIGLGIAQHIVSAILFFLLLLAIRNHFRIK